MEFQMKHNFLLSLFLLLAACTPTIVQTEEPAANLPNPAAVYCEEHGYTSEIRTAEDGSQGGVCVFPDGRECDEWVFYRGDCAPDSQSAPEAIGMPNPAAVYCEQQGFMLETVTAQDGSQSANCIFPDGSKCEEWAFYRHECGPASQGGSDATPTEFSTPIPITPADYQGWWTYTHAAYGFSIMLPEDWIAEEFTINDALLNGHSLSLRPSNASGTEGIRLTFRRFGEDTPLWPMGVGQGDFIPQGTLDVFGQPAQRVLLVCPTGEVTAIWYHQAEGQPNIVRGDLEFGFIFSAASSHCETGYSLSGKMQHVGEMVIASLQVPEE
jgi:putative hemolysin